MSRLGKAMVVALIVVGCVIGAMTTHDAYTCHHMEKQALAADLVEGDQE